MPELRVAKNRLHIDVRVGNGPDAWQRILAKVDELVTAGGSVLSTFDGHHVVMAVMARRLCYRRPDLPRSRRALADLRPTWCGRWTSLPAIRGCRTEPLPDPVVGQREVALPVTATTGHLTGTDHPGAVLIDHQRVALRETSLIARPHQSVVCQRDVVLP